MCDEGRAFQFGGPTRLTLRSSTRFSGRLLALYGSLAKGRGLIPYIVGVPTFAGKIRIFGSVLQRKFPTILSFYPIIISEGAMRKN